MKNLQKLTSIVSKDSYPLVYIPSQLLLFLSNKETYEISDEVVIKYYSLEKPKEPKLPPKPVLPDKYKYKRCKRYVMKEGFLYILFPIVFLFLGLFQSVEFHSCSLFIFILFVLMPIIILMFKIKTRVEWFNKKIPLSKEEEQQLSFKFVENENMYKIRFDKYINDFDAYKKRLLVFQNELEVYKNKYILNGYYEKLKTVIKPIRSNKQIQKGKTEDDFLKLLMNEFSSEIKIDMQLNTYNSSFYPDFVYESKSFGFYIDIEIDEKYEFISKKPIHYIESDDEARNDFFIKSNWFIIRFAEQQIISHPNECILFIKSVIENIIRPYTNIEKNACNLPCVRRWTYEDSYLDGKCNNRG